MYDPESSCCHTFHQVKLLEAIRSRLWMYLTKTHCQTVSHNLHPVWLRRQRPPRSPTSNPTAHASVKILNSVRQPNWNSVLPTTCSSKARASIGHFSEPLTASRRLNQYSVQISLNNSQRTCRWNTLATLTLSRREKRLCWSRTFWKRTTDLSLRCAMNQRSAWLPVFCLNQRCERPTSVELSFTSTRWMELAVEVDAALV